MTRSRLQVQAPALAKMLAGARTEDVRSIAYEACTRASALVAASDLFSKALSHWRAGEVDEKLAQHVAEMTKEWDQEIALRELGLVLATGSRSVGQTRHGDRRHTRTRSL